jgi:glycosyltransferase 2 family protein
VKSTTRVVISLVLTIAFLALFLRSFDLGAAWASLRGSNAALLIAALLLNLLAYPIRAWRWRHLLAPIRERIGLYNLTSTTVIGFMVSFLVPFRLGEVVRPVLLARRERLSSSAAIATIALERLFDAMTVMVLFLVFSLSAYGHALLAPSEPGGARSHAAIFLRQGALGASILVAVGLPLVLVLVVFPRQVIAWLHGLNRGGPATRFGRGILIMEQFLGGLGSLRRGKELAAIIVSSLTMWLVIDLSVWAGLLAFGLPLRFFDTFLLMVALTVGISVPTPGGVGPYEYFCQISLTDIWGVPAAVAGAVAVTLHAVAVLPPIIIGLLLMWRDGVRPAEVRSLAHVDDPPAVPTSAPPPGERRGAA